MPDHAGSPGRHTVPESRRTGRAADLTGREDRAVTELLAQVPPRFRAANSTSTTSTAALAPSSSREPTPRTASSWTKR